VATATTESPANAASTLFRSLVGRTGHRTGPWCQAAPGRFIATCLLALRFGMVCCPAVQEVELLLGSASWLGGVCDHRQAVAQVECVSGEFDFSDERVAGAFCARKIKRP